MRLWMINHRQKAIHYADKGYSSLISNHKIRPLITEKTLRHFYEKGNFMNWKYEGGRGERQKGIKFSTKSEKVYKGKANEYNKYSVYEKMFFRVSAVDKSRDLVYNGRQAARFWINITFLWKTEPAYFGYSHQWTRKYFICQSKLFLGFFY